MTASNGNGRKQRLELTWIGKDDRPRLEPRILLPVPEQSYSQGTPGVGGILIHGDNLLALKSLEQQFANKVKCVYIDPPYNTGAAFPRYDDGVEHSLWLSLMRDRLDLLRRLLSDDGLLFMQLDDNEGHYGKVLGDEVFGRNNFIATFIWRKVDSPNDNKVAVTPDHEFILAYAKDATRADLRQQAAEDILEAYRGPDEQGRYFRDRLLKKNGKASLRIDRPSMWFPVRAPDGKDVYPIHDDGREARWALGKDSVTELLASGSIVWKNRGTDQVPQWIPYTREYAPANPSRPHFTIWDDLDTTRQTKAHQKELFGAGNEFETPKPEDLIERILRLSTSEGDLVLDSFAGSGTTGAVAQKMGRRWIMVELGDHATTHIAPRLKKVIDGSDTGGITERIGWEGGGGFRMFRLAPSLIETDQFGQKVISKQYNAEMLAEAMCKHMGFTYAPSQDPALYWQHGHSSERDFIFVTTQALTHDTLKALSHDVGDDRTLLICCKTFRARLSDFDNLTVKKIPQAVLENCEWGRDDYSLNIAKPPEDATSDPDDGPDDDGNGGEPAPRRRGAPQRGSQGAELRAVPAPKAPLKMDGTTRAPKVVKAAIPNSSAPIRPPSTPAKPKAAKPVAAPKPTPAKKARAAAKQKVLKKTAKQKPLAKSKPRRADDRQGRLL